MKLIRKQHNGYALLFASGICLAVWLGIAFMLEAVLRKKTHRLCLRWLTEMLDICQELILHPMIPLVVR